MELQAVSVDVALQIALEMPSLGGVRSRRFHVRPVPACDAKILFHIAYRLPTSLKHRSHDSPEASQAMLSAPCSKLRRASARRSCARRASSPPDESEKSAVTLGLCHDARFAVEQRTSKLTGGHADLLRIPTDIQRWERPAADRSMDFRPDPVHFRDLRNHFRIPGLPKLHISLDIAFLCQTSTARSIPTTSSLLTLPVRPKL